MKRFIRKICFWILYKTNSKKNNLPMSQILAELECVISGHTWKSKVHGNKGPYEVKTKDRVYCTRCGQKYHEHTYDKNSVKQPTNKQ